MRFAEARARGTALHVREEAMFTLKLLGDAAHALALAQQNWQAQREPADARILLEAAIAAHQPQGATEAVKWMEQTGIEDPVLRRRIRIRRAGGRSTVAWHPGANLAPLKDVPAATAHQFACVESGNVWTSAVTVAPGAEHQLAVTYEIVAL